MEKLGSHSEYQGRQGQVSHGNNIAYFRRKKHWSQKGLSLKLEELGHTGWTQRKISDLESLPIVERPVLQQIADALDIGVDWLETYNEDLALHIYNNTFHGGAPAIGNNQDCTFTATTFDKVIEQLLEANKSLLESLLVAEREKNKLLQEQLNSLRNNR